MIPHWTDAPPNERKRDNGAVFQLGGRVKVKGQGSQGVIGRWDGGRAVVLGDDDWWCVDDDDGTLACYLWDLVKW